MREVFEASLQFPTIVFTVLLAIVAVMWLLSLVGFGDFDGLDGIDDIGDGLTGDSLDSVGLADVPVTVVASIVAIAGWAFSVLVQIHLLKSLAGTLFVVAAIGSAVAAVVIGLGITMLAAPKLSQIFQTHVTHTAAALIGSIAEVRSATVTTTTGYGDVREPDGTMSRVDLRARTDVESAWKTGDRGMVVDYDADDNTYTVDELPDILAD